MAVYVDLINTGTLSDGPEGKRQTALYLVSGVTGDLFNRRANALEHPEIPRKFSQHQRFPECVVTEKTVEPVDDSPTRFIVRVLWSELRPGQNLAEMSGAFGPLTWSGGSRSFAETITRDVNGELMYVYYRGTPALEVIDLDTGEVTTNVVATSLFRSSTIASATVDRSLQTLRGRRWERNTPEFIATRYRERVNASAWRGYAPKTVLCFELSWDAAERGGYNVTYEFVINPKTWAHEGAISINGLVPSDATPGNGLQTFEIYETVDFGPLSLT